jgi:hypothetical protein
MPGCVGRGGSGWEIQDTIAWGVEGGGLGFGLNGRHGMDFGVQGLGRFLFFPLLHQLLSLFEILRFVHTGGNGSLRLSSVFFCFWARVGILGLEQLH